MESRPGNVARGRFPLSTVRPRLVNQVRPAHPCPLARGVLPQIVEPSQGSVRVVAATTKEPEISGCISPSNHTVSCSGDIARGGHPGSSVGSRLADHVSPTHPRPLAGTKLPQVVEEAVIPNRVETVSAEKPEASRSIDPTGGLLSRTGNVAGGSHPRRSVRPRLVDGVSAILPGPLVSEGWGRWSLHVLPDAACGKPEQSHHHWHEREDTGLHSVLRLESPVSSPKFTAVDFSRLPVRGND